MLRAYNIVFALSCLTLTVGACAGDSASPLTATSATGSGGAGGTSATTSNNGGASGQGGDSSSSSGGSGGHAPDPCVIAAGQSIADTCEGVFVSPTGDDDSGDGSAGQPYATLQRAIDTHPSAVYLCGDDGQALGGAVVTESVAIHGGFACGTWVYSESTTTPIAGVAGAPVLSIRGAGTTVSLVDLAITAPDATAPGSSAIGILVADAALSLQDVAVHVGRGADGAKGEPPIGAGAAGTPGKDGKAGCVDGETKPGGDGGQLTIDGVDVSGGSGGNGRTTSGGDNGSDAEPQPQPNASGTKDGKGGTKQASSGCEPGHPGAEGLPGEAAPGATGLGTLDTDGYHPDPGATGEPGTHGYGGGGGGGAKQCVNGLFDGGVLHPYAGPGGGGGGSGGYGGKGGNGGGGGGSSLGIVAAHATLSLAGVSIETGQGGKGGDGAVGQDGGPGGDPGLPGERPSTDSARACAGGVGGQGGKGGRGGGGLGGHSIGVAYVGADVPDPTSVTIQPGDAGEGGAGDGAPASAGVSESAKGF